MKLQNITTILLSATLISSCSQGKLSSDSKDFSGDNYAEITEVYNTESSFDSNFKYYDVKLCYGKGKTAAQSESHMVWVLPKQKNCDNGGNWIKPNTFEFLSYYNNKISKQGIVIGSTTIYTSGRYLENLCSGSSYFSKCTIDITDGKLEIKMGIKRRKSLVLDYESLELKSNNNEDWVEYEFYVNTSFIINSIELSGFISRGSGTIELIHPTGQKITHRDNSYTSKTSTRFKNLDAQGIWKLRFSSSSSNSSNTLSDIKIEFK